MHNEQKDPNEMTFKQKLEAQGSTVEEITLPDGTKKYRVVHAENARSAIIHTGGGGSVKFRPEPPRAMPDLRGVK